MGWRAQYQVGKPQVCRGVTTVFSDSHSHFCGTWRGRPSRLRRQTWAYFTMSVLDIPSAERQGCCLLCCLFILGISVTANLPLCWVMGRKIINTVGYNFLSSSCYQSSGLLINHLFCGPIQISLDANNTLFIAISSTVRWGPWVLQPCNPCSVIFFCCFQIVIHISLTIVLVSVIQISPHWPVNPIN